MGNVKEKLPNHAYFEIFLLAHNEHNPQFGKLTFEQYGTPFEIDTKPMTYIIIVTLWSDLSASLFLSSTARGGQ